MIISDRHTQQTIKEQLLAQLKREADFWSYDPESVTLDTIRDDELIALTLRHLDLPEIGQLFKIFSFRKIKTAWMRLLVPQG